jgi:hypothetical protein
MLLAFEQGPDFSLETHECVPGLLRTTHSGWLVFRPQYLFPYGKGKHLSFHPPAKLLPKMTYAGRDEVTRLFFKEIRRQPKFTEKGMAAGVTLYYGSFRRAIPTRASLLHMGNNRSNKAIYV